MVDATKSRLSLVMDTVRDGRATLWALRLIVAAIGVAAWFGTQALIGHRPLTSSGIGDGMHLLFTPLNRFLIENPKAANGLLIISSGLVDLLAVFILLEWLFGRSVRPLLGLAIVLALRQVMQALCALPIPPNMIWHYPGFPSLLVTYGVANDFFFSAHTAITVFAATELARLGRGWLKGLAVFCIVFEAVTVLVLRIHYTMDVFTAIITALYVAHITRRISPGLDRRLAKAFPQPAE